MSGTSAWNDVARFRWYAWLGGGRSTATDWVSVRVKSDASVVGIRFGNVRSVIDAMPIGTSGSVGAQAQREPLGAREPESAVRARRRLHRERRVEDEERLRICSLVDEPRADDDRLRGGDRDERREQHEGDDDRHDRARTRMRKRERAPDHASRVRSVARSAASGRSGSEREQRVERRQKRQAAHQYPLPIGVAPRPRPKP